MARERTVLLSGSVALVAVLGIWATISLTDSRRPGAAGEHATVGVGRGAGPPPIRDVTVQPWSTSQPEAPSAKTTLANASTDTPAMQSEEAGEPNPLEGLTIAGQRFQRGGLGSQARVTFTLRNRNDFPVTGIEMKCAFSSRDGRYTTERRHTISEVIDARSRKTFPRELVGFVNVAMSKGRCNLVTASRGTLG